MLRRPTQDRRDALHKQFDTGNFKDAYDGFRAMALNKDDDPRQVGDDMQLAIAALSRLGRLDESDEFREAVIAVHKSNWRLLQAAAESLEQLYNPPGHPQYADQPVHYGFRIAGKFYRGNRRGGGELVNSLDRDHVRALQLMQDAMGQMNAENDGAAKGKFYIEFAHMLLGGRGGQFDAWRLQTLTNLKELPDYEPGWGYYNGGETRGAPVDADGNPIYYKAPKRWADAANDGERWRWTLVEAVEMSADLANEARMELANFLHGQFDVQTMAGYGLFGTEVDDTKKEQTGPFAVQTLGEDETIARLATGIKRFKLPDDFNFIKIYQTVADNPKTGHGGDALDTLAGIFENRRQYPKAADYWRRAIKEYGPGPNDYRKLRLEQIIANWGRFEPMVTQPAGKGATVDFTFRNGNKMSFEAHALKVEKLLEDVKNYIKTRPGQPDYQKLDISNIGWRIVERSEKEYLGEKVASWDLELKPRPDHFDRRITVATPLQKAGAYLLVGKMADGNTSRIIVWLDDTAIVKKPLEHKTLYVVADAVSGKPLKKINLEFFGYQWKYIPNGQPTIEWENFADFTNADGEAIVDEGHLKQNYQWLVIARGDDGRFAHLGFSNVWYNNYYDAEYNATKAYSITDRPVYRPGQTVKFKFWVRHAKYDQDNTSDFAKQTFKVELHDPRGQKVLSKDFTTDEYGGLEGEYALPSTATLGVYRIVVIQDPRKFIQQNGNFRVEEYKKPEYEVTVDAPTKPVMLGEKVKATIKAKYYFGSPVTQAKVHYKVARTSYTETWYPIAPWDWFYGKGYWWFAYDYDWYPGFIEWGCRRPSPWWFGRGYQPPEIVADVEAPIGADGTVSVDIDTAVAEAVHGDQDHKYEITAEVTDDSRRTIVGTGDVLVARKPFTVTVWLDRGYLRAGDAVNAHFAAHTLAGKPVEGKGHLVLYRVRYDKDGAPVETAVDEWNVDTSDEGEGRQQMKVVAAGQYRLSYKLTDSEKHTIEGAYVFTVTGEGFDGANFHFNDIELIPDSREYKPGEKVKLMVNTNRIEAPVWLFVRPSNGIYQLPQMIRMDGKSTVVEIGVTKKDMPNFFVEALTIANGKVFTEVKEIVVPPEQRVLNLAVKPSAEIYKPGQKAKINVKLTDLAGKPFVGSTVLTMYDKALEYISGGSNTADIKEFFWKWRRGHNMQMETNLGRYFYNLLKSGETGMNDLGVFGHLAQLDELNQQAGQGKGAGFGGMRSRGLGMQMEKAAAGMVPAAPMAANGMALGADAGKQDGEQQHLRRAEAAGKPAGGGPGAGPPMVEPTIRTKFADTALWVGSLSTNDQGEAEVTLDMPENLTSWKIKVWGMGHGTKVGQGDAEVVTRKDLIVRLQAPRFFVEKDEVVLSANVHNYLKTKKTVQVSLELAGKTLDLNPRTSRKR